MNNTDKKEFAIIITGLAETFMGKDKPSKNLITLYYNALNVYQIEDIRTAGNHIMRTWKFHFLPKPAHFIELIDGNESDNALEMWQHVLDEISTKGVMGADFDDVTMSAINACGGKEAIGHASIEDLTWRCKDFIANYKVVAKRENFKQIENVKLKELTEGIG